MRSGFVAVLAALFVCAGSARAEPAPAPTPAEKAQLAKIAALRDSVKPLRGTIALPSAKATLSLGQHYYFLGAEDARKVLTEAWGNPPSAADGVLGLVFAEGQTFLDEDGWAAVVTYSPTAYVSDDDAKTADYDKLMGEMKEADKADNAERKKAGFEPINTVGWAQPPSYEPARHDLIWARDLEFVGQEHHALNYDVRHLGRNGVLSLNIVSALSQLPQVQAAAHDLARTAEFDAGSRYADYHKGDKTAGYGLAGLVAAGAGLAVASKTGLLAAGLLILKKAAFLLIAGFAGAAAWVRNLFKKKAPQFAPTNAAETEAEGTDEGPD